MNKNLDGLTVKFNKSASDRITEEWEWLIGSDKNVLLISVVGDMFLEDNLGRIYWLEIGSGELSLVADTIQEFEAKLGDSDQVNEWFMIKLSTELIKSNKTLKSGQVFSFKKFPILGGSYTVDNFLPLDIESHFNYSGDIHRQLKNLPDGTRFKIKILDQ